MEGWGGGLGRLSVAGRPLCLAFPAGNGLQGWRCQSPIRQKGGVAFRGRRYWVGAVDFLAAAGGGGGYREVGRWVGQGWVGQVPIVGLGCDRSGNLQRYVPYMK